jgi:RNA polymerase sigma factor (sigma-70 family)
VRVDVYTGSERLARSVPANMGYPANLSLVDNTGTPLAAHIQRALLDLLPKFKRRFPDLKDDAVVLNILEKAGQRIADHERQHGPIEKLHGYAWVTLRSVAISWLRRSDAKVELATIGSEASEAVLGGMPAESGSPAQVERALLVREVLNELSEEERRICIWKLSGFSSKEIAHHRGSSPAAVDTLFYRARQRLRAILGNRESDASLGQTGREPKRDTMSASRSWTGRGKKNDEQQ